MYNKTHVERVNTVPFGRQRNTICFKFYVVSYCWLTNCTITSNTQSVACRLPITLVFFYQQNFQRVQRNFSCTARISSQITARDVFAKLVWQ